MIFEVSVGKDLHAFRADRIHCVEYFAKTHTLCIHMTKDGLDISPIIIHDVDNGVYNYVVNRWKQELAVR